MWKHLLAFMCMLFAMPAAAMSSEAPPQSGLLVRPTASIEQIMPSGVWTLQLDFHRDGRMEGRSNSWPVDLRFICGFVVGRPADEAPERARSLGELVVDKGIAFTWRQDNTNIVGYTHYVTGRVTGWGRIVGTWSDNTGQAGDFVLTFEH